MHEQGDTEGDKPLNYITSLFAFKPRQILLAEQQHRQLINECDLKMVNKQPQQVSNCSTGNTELKLAVLKSILSYLHNNGFHKTLNRFIKEARIESDDWKTTSVDLEDIYARYAMHCQNSDVKIKGSVQEHETVEKDVSGLSTAEETSSKKKKKEKKKEENIENDVPAKSEPIEHSKSADLDKNILKDKDTGTKGKSKENKSKKRSDSFGQANDDTDEGIGKLKGVGSINEQKDESEKESISLSQLVESNFKDAEILPVVAEKELASSTVANGHDKITEGAGKAKDKKEKKKRQMVAHVDDGQLGKTKTADCDDGTDVLLGNGKAKSKEKKKKKTVSENNESELLDNVKSLESGDRKVSKKRKLAASNDGEEQPVEDLVNGESKRRKIAEVGDHHTEKSEDEEAMIKGDKLKNGVQQSSEPKSLKKERTISSEPRTVNAFQRVKVEEVKFVDDRLQNNSYWAKDGAEYGYGAKAQEVLGQVKGKDFRHEKTKKKRGSYRGGQIDFQAHSVKFNYSDEE